MPNYKDQGDREIKESARLEKEATPYAELTRQACARQVYTCDGRGDG